MPAARLSRWQSGVPGGPRTSKIDVEICRLADRQYGVVARRQLLGLGLTQRMLRTRLASARLLELHRGVYAVGHRQLTRDGEWLGAVLAAGSDAALSHRSAAALHGLREERSRRVDVSTADRRLTTNWIELHGRRVLADADVTVVRRIPVTTVSRTLLDLGELLSLPQLARAVNEADVLGLLDAARLDAVFDRASHHRGAAALRTTLDAHYGPVLLRSELEQRFKELLADAGLPRAEHNVKVGMWEVDALWPAVRLAVELDSRFHDTPAARRRDARKEAALRAAGWTVVRYRWRDVVGAPARTVAELREAVGSPVSV